MYLSMRWVSALWSFLFFFFEIRPIEQQQKKKNIDQNDSKKKQKTMGPALNPFEGTVQIRGWNFGVKFSKLSGASQKCHFFRNFMIYVWNRVLVILRSISWWVANWATRLTSIFSLSSCLFSTVSNKFNLDRKRQFLYEFGVKKLVFWVFADISARSSRKKKGRNFHMRFFFARSMVCQG